VFTRFTPRTLFTQFTEFTRPFTLGPGPGPDPGPRPFVRFGGTLLAPEDLTLAQFEEFSGVAEELASVGVHGIDELACVEVRELADALEFGQEEAAPLVETAQHHLRRLAGRA
jgi:hypothetical protein